MSIRNKVSESFSEAINAMEEKMEQLVDEAMKIHDPSTSEEFNRVQDKISKLRQRLADTKRLRNNVLLQVFYDDQNY
ncbi:hypothetical protein CC31p123 [Enterobacter phage CC31]|uniref:Uncharacterized protein n=1 Tax=Enterobacter phage CC31 TaxID=709484 RepID=E5DID4_9CAUD|nr:hypothetical protein CC31p123 [Enterobacter phage CC31]ADB81619.1 hypothetical protein CC31p123 [Enterobacter phage CC31]